MSLTSTDAPATQLPTSTTDGADVPIGQPSRQHPDSILKVAKFDEIFIKSDSKKIMDKNRPLLWISHPTGFTSRGYHALLDDHDSITAMAIYAVFMQLVKLSVQAGPYGSLQHSNGSPFSIGFIARTVGIDRELIKTSISVLVDINWLLSIPTTSRQCRDDIPPASRLQTDKTDKTDRQTTVLSDKSDESDLFDQFWNTYAKKDGRKKSEAAFHKSVKIVAKKDKLSTHDAAVLITDRARIYVKIIGGDSRDKRFQKNPLTWLSGEHWNDELITRNDDDSRPGVLEWLTLLEIVPHINVNSPYKDSLKDKIGQKATDIACKIGIPKIQDANSFERQELRKTFELGMSK